MSKSLSCLKSYHEKNKNKHPEAKTKPQPEFNSQLQHVLVVWPWINYLISLSIIFCENFLGWFWEINEMMYVNSRHSANGSSLPTSPSPLRSCRPSDKLLAPTGHQGKGAVLPLHLWVKDNEIHEKQKWVKKAKVGELLLCVRLFLNIQDDE